MIFMCVCVCIYMYICIYVWYVCVCAFTCVNEGAWCHCAHVEDREQPWVSLHPFHFVETVSLFQCYVHRERSGILLILPFPPSHCRSTDVCYHDQCYEEPNSDTHTCISSLPTKSSYQSYRPIIFLLRQEESTLQANFKSAPCPWSF